jgi:hypothetical protein
MSHSYCRKQLLTLLFARPEWFTPEINEELKKGLEETIDFAKDDNDKKESIPLISIIISKLK